ncbi:RNB1 [Auxenochlorella protothecoides x Auxenochlorella symbiontica]
MSKNDRLKSHPIHVEEVQLVAESSHQSAQATPPAQKGRRGILVAAAAKAKHTTSEPGVTSGGRRKHSGAEPDSSKTTAVPPKAQQTLPACAKSKGQGLGSGSKQHHAKKAAGKKSQAAAVAAQVQQGVSKSEPKVLSLPRPPTLPPPRAPSIKKYSPADLQQGLKRGTLFRAVIRYNASDTSQAFATLPGLSHDILIKGALAQGHSMEGDEVALLILPFQDWYVRSEPARGAGRAGGPASAGATREGTPAKAAGQPGAKTLAAPSGSGAVVPVPQPGASSPHGSKKHPEAEGPKQAALPSTPLGTDGVHQLASQLDKSLVLEPAPSAASPQALLGHLQLLLSRNPSARATGAVVGILQPSPRRERVVGMLLADPRTRQLCLVPKSPCLPRMSVDASRLPDSIKRAMAAATGTQHLLVSGRVLQWKDGMECPTAEVRGSLGQAGDLLSETAACLASEGITQGDSFDSKVMACLPQTPWRIGEEECVGRRDLRSARTFSIDPPTARDLDDALSIQELGGGSYCVGVHIADVSHFVRHATELDEEALTRSTSVYMVHNVIPMLPRLLCEELCSLNAGVDRLAFSIVWDMGADGSIRSTWIGRSIIHSCAKLSYLHVQEVLEGWEPADCPSLTPVVLTPGHTWEEIKRDCLALHALAKALRAARFQRGALRLDNTKLSFALDEAGNPVDFIAEIQTDANRLVEEFMLLANTTAANKIADVFPDRALLRRHPAPSPFKLTQLAGQLEALNVTLDVRTAGSLQASLERLRATHSDANLVSAVTQMVTKPMMTAAYFCTGTSEDASGWGHYALAAPRYTHFTSPIRRYPDVAVHRQLAAALEVEAGAEPAVALQRWGCPEAEELERIALHCNERKSAAKAVQDGVLHLHLLQMLERKPHACWAVVVGVGGPRYLDVYIPLIGKELRVQVSDLVAPGPSPRNVVGAWDKQDMRLTLSAGQQEAEAEWAKALWPVVVAPGVESACLPLTLRLLSQLPLIVTSKTRGDGSPAYLIATAYLAGPAVTQPTPMLDQA